MENRATHFEVFISYSRKDYQTALLLRDALLTQGIRCWWDNTMLPGTPFDNEIRHHLEGARCVIVLWSEASVASDWVRDEANEAKNRNTLLPVIIDKVEPPLGFRRIQAAQLVGWNGNPEVDDFRRVLAAVRAMIGDESAEYPAVAPPAPAAPQERKRLVALLLSSGEEDAPPSSTMGTLAQYRERSAIYEKLIEASVGCECVSAIKGEYTIAFPSPSTAVAFALRLQAALKQGGLPADRVAIHVTEVIEERDREGGNPDLVGPDAGLVTALLSLAGRNQILMSRFAFDLARRVFTWSGAGGVAAIEWLNHGPFEFAACDFPLDVCEVGEAGGALLAIPDSNRYARRVSHPDLDLVVGWRPAKDAPIPNTPWILGDRLGEGAFGEVWRGRDRSLKTPHVFKFCFRADHARSLKREATLFRILREQFENHPNIVSIEQVFLDRVPLFIVLQDSGGLDLERWCQDHADFATWPLSERAELVAQIGEALAAAHSCGIVHRDVKPSNIIVTRQGSRLHARLTDFGIGKITSEKSFGNITRLGFTQTLAAPGQAEGTQLYMAPELFVGGEASFSTDIYALGVVWYQLVVGSFHRPVTADWPNDVGDELLRGDLMRCLARDPAMRYSRVEDLVKAARDLEQRRAALREARRLAEIQENQKYYRGITIAAAVEAPLIAYLVATVLHFSEDPTYAYDFANAYHMPLYLFYGVLTAMYFGLNTSLRTYFRDRANGRVPESLRALLKYICTTTGKVSVVIAIQCALFILVGNSTLAVRGMFFYYLPIMMLVGICGASVGFLLASLLTERDSAVRASFWIIVAQMLFTGAIVRFEEMNRQIETPVFFGNPPPRTRMDDTISTPPVANFFPTKWGLDALIILQVKYNPLAIRQERLQAEIDRLVQRNPRTAEESDRLESCKDALALLSGAEAGSVAQMERKLAIFDDFIAGGALDVERLRAKPWTLPAERLYTNQKLSDLVAKAETEQNDYRRETKINPAFAPETFLFGKRINSVLFDAAILAGYSLVAFLGFFGVLYGRSMGALEQGPWASWKERLRRWAPRGTGKDLKPGLEASP